MAETIPGGRYEVGGVWVDANGKPVAAPTSAEKAAATREANEQRERELLADQAAAALIGEKDAEIAALRAQLAAAQTAQQSAAGTEGAKDAAATSAATTKKDK